jgi:hypothetical protein
MIKTPAVIDIDRLEVTATSKDAAISARKRTIIYRSTWTRNVVR